MKRNPTHVIGTITTWILTVGALCCVLFAVIMTFWSFSRQVPFEMISYEIKPAKAGEYTTAVAVVERDIERQCSALFSRALYDSAGVRYELTNGAQLMNAKSLEEYNIYRPNSLSFSIHIPKEASAGSANVVTTIDYTCNPIHQFYPIPLVLTMHMDILPP